MSIIRILHERGCLQQGDRAFTFLNKGEEESHHFSFGELDRRARTIAVALRESGVSTGDRVLLIYSPGVYFIDAFFGCLYAGAIAVPVKLPSRHKSLEDIERVFRDCLPVMLLTDQPAYGELRARVDNSVLLRGVTVLVTDQFTPEEIGLRPAGWRFPEITADSPAFLQYTSGSTGSPKGVCISHGNIISNMKMIEAVFEHNSDTVILSWLPLFHDMGLIGSMLQPVFIGRPCVLMPPVSFLQRPMRWLRAISRYRATSSGGPNFAYDLCCSKYKPELLGDTDLSCWKIAYNGSEPVRAVTLRKFTDLFSSYGFRYRSLHPCYGLAESTLLAAAGTPSEDPRTILVRQEQLACGRVGRLLSSDPDELAAKGEKALELVSCGRPPVGERMQIGHPVTEQACVDGEVGEIWLGGPHITSGYWNKPELDTEVFAGNPHGSGTDRFFKTGDLGFVLEDELYVCGRLKDMIIFRGRNLFPADIEQYAEESHPCFVGNGAIAFCAGNEEEGRLILVMEVKRTFRDSADQQELLGTVRLAMSAAMDLSVHDLVLVGEMTIPRTYSGKLRRAFCKQQYEAGELCSIAGQNPDSQKILL